ncbi:NUDIX hydrolase [Alteribacter aurantiacus]|uniref:NUDIX hydrolase n=1 Tax=Alteribacter aurantiacus TaxID=254410 RepID=UPI00047ED0ED|nr:NUDIX domain-containing protein [Alteribacter aurantiacus]
MRDRGAVVIIENKKVGLIKREREGSTYYVFPGGGVEEGETPDQTARREAFEELGVIVKIKRLFTTFEHDGIQYYYLAERLDGTFGSGSGDEYVDRSRDRGSYTPVWVGIERLSTIDLRPRQVGLKVQSSVVN